MNATFGIGKTNASRRTPRIFWLPDLGSNQVAMAIHVHNETAFAYGELHRAQGVLEL